MLKIILNLINQSGKSDYAIEKTLGFTQGTISNWRRAKNKVSTEAVIKLAEYFNVSTDYLLLGVKTTLSEEEKRLVSLIAELTDEETKELSNFVDYLISKRK